MLVSVMEHADETRKSSVSARPITISPEEVWQIAKGLAPSNHLMQLDIAPRLFIWNDELLFSFQNSRENRSMIATASAPVPNVFSKSPIDTPSIQPSVWDFRSITIGTICAECKVAVGASASVTDTDFTTRWMLHRRSTAIGPLRRFVAAQRHFQC